MVGLSKRLAQHRVPLDSVDFDRVHQIMQSASHNSVKAAIVEEWTNLWLDKVQAQRINPHPSNYCIKQEGIGYSVYRGGNRQAEFDFMVKEGFPYIIEVKAGNIRDSYIQQLKRIVHIGQEIMGKDMRLIVIAHAVNAAHFRVMRDIYNKTEFIPSCLHRDELEEMVVSYMHQYPSKARHHEYHTRDFHVRRIAQ